MQQEDCLKLGGQELRDCSPSHTFLSDREETTGVKNQCEEDEGRIFWKNSSVRVRLRNSHDSLTGFVFDTVVIFVVVAHSSTTTSSTHVNCLGEHDAEIS